MDEEEEGVIYLMIECTEMTGDTAEEEMMTTTTNPDQEEDSLIAQNSSLIREILKDLQMLRAPQKTC